MYYSLFFYYQFYESHILPCGSNYSFLVPLCPHRGGISPLTFKLKCDKVELRYQLK